MKSDSELIELLNITNINGDEGFIRLSLKYKSSY